MRCRRTSVTPASAKAASPTSPGTRIARLDSPLPPRPARGGQGRSGWSDRLQARGVVPAWVPWGPGLGDAVEQRCGSWGGSFCSSSSRCLVAAVMLAMSAPAALRRVPLPLDRVTLACVAARGLGRPGLRGRRRGPSGAGARPRPACESGAGAETACCGTAGRMTGSASAGPLGSRARVPGTWSLRFTVVFFLPGPRSSASTVTGLAAWPRSGIVNWPETALPSRTSLSPTSSS